MEIQNINKDINLNFSKIDIINDKKKIEELINESYFDIFITQRLCKEIIIKTITDTFVSSNNKLMINVNFDLINEPFFTGKIVFNCKIKAQDGIIISGYKNFSNSKASLKFIAINDTKNKYQIDDTISIIITKTSDYYKSQYNLCSAQIFIPELYLNFTKNTSFNRTLCDFGFYLDDSIIPEILETQEPEQKLHELIHFYGDNFKSEKYRLNELFYYLSTKILNKDFVEINKYKKEFKEFLTKNETILFKGGKEEPQGLASNEEPQEDLRREPAQRLKKKSKNSKFEKESQEILNNDLLINKPTQKLQKIIFVESIKELESYLPFNLLDIFVSDKIKLEDTKKYSGVSIFKPICSQNLDDYYLIISYPSNKKTRELSIYLLKLYKEQIKEYSNYLYEIGEKITDKLKNDAKILYTNFYDID